MPMKANLSTPNTTNMSKSVRSASKSVRSASKLPQAPPSPTATITSVGLSSHGGRGLPYLELEHKETLYNRLGGEAFIKELTALFFEEIGKKKGLARFFVNVPVTAIQLHQGQFFKVLFGANEEKPSADELLDYMILTHVRLFRDLGLDASHFDLVAVAFIDAMNALNVPADLQDECLAVVGPLRVAFDYGATVARKERRMTSEAFRDAPLATVKTMRSDTEAKLPAGLKPPSTWLRQFLGGRENVRAWTAALTHRFVVQDEVLSATFFNLAYLDMEPYCHSFLELAFANQMGNDIRLPIYVLRTVRFPCGLTKPSLQLHKSQFESMCSHFYDIGIELGRKEQCWLIPEEVAQVTDALRERRSMFIGAEPTLQLSALERHHRLRHNPSQAPAETLEQQLEAKEKTYEKLKSRDHKNSKKPGKTTKKTVRSPREQARKTSRRLWCFNRVGRNKAQPAHVSAQSK